MVYNMVIYYRIFYVKLKAGYHIRMAQELLCHKDVNNHTIGKLPIPGL